MTVNELRQRNNKTRYNLLLEELLRFCGIKILYWRILYMHIASFCFRKAIHIYLLYHQLTFILKDLTDMSIGSSDSNEK
jgi:hypothetical protein